MSSGLVLNGLSLPEVSRLFLEVSKRLKIIEGHRQGQAEFQRSTSVAVAKFTGGRSSSGTNPRETGLMSSLVLGQQIINPTESTGKVKLSGFFVILNEQSDETGRFRLYRTQAGRDADLSRIIGVQDPPSDGLILEDVFTASIMEIQSIPVPGAPGDDGFCYWSWDGASTADITLNILTTQF